MTHRRPKSQAHCLAGRGAHAIKESCDCEVRRSIASRKGYERLRRGELRGAGAARANKTAIARSRWHHRSPAAERPRPAGRGRRDAFPRREGDITPDLVGLPCGDGSASRSDGTGIEIRRRHLIEVLLANGKAAHPFSTDRGARREKVASTPVPGLAGKGGAPHRSRLRQSLRIVVDANPLRHRMMIGLRPWTNRRGVDPVTRCVVASKWTQRSPQGSADHFRHRLGTTPAPEERWRIVAYRFGNRVMVSSPARCGHGPSISVTPIAKLVAILSSSGGRSGETRSDGGVVPEARLACRAPVVTATFCRDYRHPDRAITDQPARMASSCNSCQSAGEGW